MTDQAGRAELRAAAESCVYPLLTVRPAEVLSLLDRLVAVEADRDRLQGERDEADQEQHRLLDALDAMRYQRDETCAQLAERDRTLDALDDLASNWQLHGTATALADLRQTLAASRPSSPDTTEATG